MKRLPAKLTIAFLLAVASTIGCQSGPPQVLNLKSPRFSCAALTRWAEKGKEQEKFRQQVAADPFPHASQLGLSGATASAARSASFR